MSVEVVFMYKHPNGKPASIATERTLFLEDYKLPLPNEYTVKFIVNGTVYREFTAEEEEIIKVPGIPSYANGSGWRSAGGGFFAPGEALDVTRDETYTLL